MNVALVAEDVTEVRVDVEVRECDELAPIPKHLPEEVVSVEAVGEGDVVADDDTVVAVMELLELEHARRAQREMSIAAREEELRPIPCAPPPREGPHAKMVVDEDTERILHLRHGGRALQGWAVELHGG